MIQLAVMVVCTYSSSYNDPFSGGPCFVDAIAGCPIHLVMPHAQPPVDVMPEVLRNNTPVTVTSSTAVVGEVSPIVTSIDYYSCTCDRTTGPMQFDELAVTITGARAGEEVLVAGQAVTIAPAAPCGQPAWPTVNDFDIQYGGCDLCPMDPVTPPNHSGGCTTAPGAGWALALGLLGLLPRRRNGSRRD